MPITQDAVLAALRTVLDPDLHKDLVSLNMIKAVKICDTAVAVDVELTTPACPLKDRIKNDVEAAVRRVPGVSAVAVTLSASVRGPAQPSAPLLPGVKNIVAVGAGKGGVGKSTIAVNLAVGLALQGAAVGLLDADIYGPSVPTLLGLPPQPPIVEDGRLLPFLVTPPSPCLPTSPSSLPSPFPSAPGAKPADANPLRVMSIGFIVEKEKALIWRGPMAHGAIKQFLEQVAWGNLDYLIVDLPPGTGDVSLTLAQLVPLTGAVIVATPQEVALMDARRAIRMFQQLGVPILGVVENMSYFICEHGQEYDIFGRGGARDMAARMGLPFLGQIPIDMQLRIHSDAGSPYANFSSAIVSSAPLTAFVAAVAAQISIRHAARPVSLEVT